VVGLITKSIAETIQIFPHPDDENEAHSAVHCGAPYSGNGSMRHWPQQPRGGCPARRWSPRSDHLHDGRHHRTKASGPDKPGTAATPIRTGRVGRGSDPKRHAETRCARTQRGPSAHDTIAQVNESEASAGYAWFSSIKLRRIFRPRSTLSSMYSASPQRTARDIA
jgi:hypothetical protein